MGKSKKLTGHPWHLEYLHMSESDSRRDKRKCKYFYISQYTREGRCIKKHINCFGSAHCSNYQEKNDKDK